jgi:hypothetical protein
MQENGVRYFPTQNETKASTSERAILTVKQKLHRYLSHKKGYAYLPILEDIAYSYIHTYHRTSGMRSSDVKYTNQEEVRLSPYFAQNPKTDRGNIKLTPFKFKIGDYVRISHLRNPFIRAYDETYSGKVFKVQKRYHRGV